MKIFLLVATVFSFLSSSVLAQETNSPQASQLHWLISQSSIARLATSMPLSALQALFDNPNTYENVDEMNNPDPLPHAKHIVYYRDEWLMQQDLAAGRLANVDGILYDDEAYDEPGNSTPMEQRLKPVPYVKNAARLLHAAGKLFIYTIGPNVGPQGQFWSRTLPLVSPYPDAIDFQTQGAEGTPDFAWQVAQYSSIYRKNGGHIMLVGIGVSPSGQSKSTADIKSGYDAALANQPPVDGFWFNMAVQSQSCTGCKQDPDILAGVEFLQSLLP